MVEQVKEEIRKLLLADKERMDKRNSLIEQIEIITAKRDKIFGGSRVPRTARLFKTQKLKDYQECQAVKEQLDEELEKTPLLSTQGWPFRNTMTLEQLAKAKSLADLGLTYDSAAEFLKSKGVIPVLKEGENPDVPETNSEYVLTHLTDFYPEGNQIKRMIDKGAKKTITGGFGSFIQEAARETIHFRVNGTVSDTNLTTWKNRRYAIIVPLSEIPESARVTSVRGIDFTIKDIVNLTDKCYILCPKEDVKIIQRANPQVKVIGFEGTAAKPFAEQFIRMLGYEHINGSDHSFESRVVDENFTKKMSEKFKNASIDQHSGTIEKAEETLVGNVYLLKGIEEGVMQGTVIINQKNVEELVNSFIRRAIDEILQITDNSPRLEYGRQEFAKLFGLKSVDEIKEHTAKEYIEVFVVQLAKLTPKQGMTQILPAENKTL